MTTVDIEMTAAVQQPSPVVIEAAAKAIQTEQREIITKEPMQTNERKMANGSTSRKARLHSGHVAQHQLRRMLQQSHGFAQLEIIRQLCAGGTMGLFASPAIDIDTFSGASHLPSQS
eukprot:Ihof_evm12s121 gene=Ihof_evmTU12s121